LAFQEGKATICTGIGSVGRTKSEPCRREGRSLERGRGDGGGSRSKSAQKVNYDASKTSAGPQSLKRSNSEGTVTRGGRD